MTMTQVRIDLRVPTPDGTYIPATGRVKWTPLLRRHVDGTVDYVVLPASFSVWLTTPPPVAEVEPTTTEWCWRVEEYTQAGTVRYVLVPDSVDIVDYGDLTEIDPNTLLPAGSSAVGGLDETALVDKINDPASATHAALIAQVDGEVNTAITNTKAGAPADLDSYAKLAAAIGSDASYSSTVSAALATKVPTTRMVAGKALSADVTITKSDVGLSSVDNTADASKPVSTAQQAAIDAAAASRQQVIYWTGTAWPAIPVHTVPIWLVSTHDAAATSPTSTNLIVGDVWKRRVA